MFTSQIYVCQVTAIGRVENGFGASHYFVTRFLFILHASVYAAEERHYSILVGRVGYQLGVVVVVWSDNGGGTCDGSGGSGVSVCLSVCLLVCLSVCDSLSL